MSTENQTPEQAAQQTENIPKDCACGILTNGGQVEESENCHPLERTWAYFLVSTSKGNKNDADWQTNQSLVCRFNTVEQFWRLHNNINAPRELDAVDLCLSHDDLILAWEHPRFKLGGRWTIRLTEMNKLNDCWLNLALGSIGEQLGGCCGVSVSIRKAYSKATLWLDSDSCRTLAQVQQVGRRAANLLARVNTKLSLQFSFFYETEEGINSEVNQKWTYYVENGVVSDCKVETEAPVPPKAQGKFAGRAGGKKGGKGKDHKDGDTNKEAETPRSPGVNRESLENTLKAAADEAENADKQEEDNEDGSDAAAEEEEENQE